MTHRIQKPEYIKTAFSITPVVLDIIDQVAAELDPPNRSAAVRKIVKEWEEVYSPARNAERNEK